MQKRLPPSIIGGMPCNRVYPANSLPELDTSVGNKLQTGVEVPIETSMGFV